jgi:hypothetical protein
MCGLSFLLLAACNSNTPTGSATNNLAAASEAGDRLVSVSNVSGLARTLEFAFYEMPDGSIKVCRWDGGNPAGCSIRPKQ